MIGEIEDAFSMDELITPASTIGDPVLDFENLNYKIGKRTREIPSRNFQVTTDDLRAKRLLG